MAPHRTLLRRPLVGVVLLAMGAGCAGNAESASPASSIAAAAGSGPTATLATSSGLPIDLVANPFRTGRTLVIPHGGGDGLYPENTMLAFSKTMAMGADVVDVDLRLTADNVLIAFHDATLDRITGEAGALLSMTYAQLANADAGWSFTDAAGDHPFRSAGVTIPTMESILVEFPDALLSLDLKDESQAMVQPVCDLLQRYGRLNDVFVGSNSDEQILSVRSTCPTVRTSAIMKDVYASRDARDTNDPDFTPAVVVDQPPFRMDGRQLVDADSLAWAHEHGVAILPWVVNDPADLQYLVDIGVDGIYTSYPDRLLKILGRYTDPG